MLQLGSDSDRFFTVYSITSCHRGVPDTENVDVQRRLMLAEATLSPLSLEQTLEQILVSQKITPSEQRWLISLCFKGSLSYQQEHLINQVYEALRHGRLAAIN